MEIENQAFELKAVLYAAQSNVKIDTETAEKSGFSTGTNSFHHAGAIDQVRPIRRSTSSNAGYLA